MPDSLPWTLAWLVPDRVLLQTIHGSVTEAHLTQIDADITLLLNTAASDAVYIIVEIDGPITPPSLSSLQRIQYISHPKLKEFYTINLLTNPVLRFMAATLSRLRGKTHREFETMALACEYIARIHATMPPVSAWDQPPTH